jgi:hypothetical protein
MFLLWLISIRRHGITFQTFPTLELECVCKMYRGFHAYQRLRKTYCFQFHPGDGGRGFFRIVEIKLHTRIHLRTSNFTSILPVPKILAPRFNHPWTTAFSVLQFLCHSLIVVEVTAIKCWHPLPRMGSHLFVIGFEGGGGKNTWHVLPFKHNPHILGFLKEKSTGHIQITEACLLTNLLSPPSK